MSYIIKNTSSLINTRLTDSARKKISEGKFNITYFQIGDSEIDYNSTVENLTDNHVLEASFNAQNQHSGNINKSNIKYPVYVDEQGTNTFGIPFNNSQPELITNTTAPTGFFDNNEGVFNKLKLGTGHTKNPNYITSFGQFNGQDNTIEISYDVISGGNPNEIEVGDFVVIYFINSDGMIDTNVPLLTYKVQVISDNLLTLDRKVPNFSSYNGSVRVMFYPSDFTYYDYETPQPYWNESTLSFEGLCDTPLDKVKIWNMNIPWSEYPAGIFSATTNTNFGSQTYLGTKEYLGYTTSSGQTNNINETFIYNSVKERVDISSEEQKCISIIHYTNNTIDHIYGEKLADNLNIYIPWLMWHKSNNSTIGETFGVKNPITNEVVTGVITSNPNSNMNEDGIRYYHLWDSNTTQPNRVGKVWPDLKIITIDDEELVAAMSYKANRNWTLPAPKLGLIVPNTFNGTLSSDDGILNSPEDTLWVTYRLDSNNHKSLHCNYYMKIIGTDTDCPPDTANVTVKFGEEFPFLTDGSTIDGFSANKIIMIVQKVESGKRPDPSGWKEIDVTSQINGGGISQSSLSTTTFQITNDGYNSASTYNLNEYIELPKDDDTLNFGDEYFFYGTVETDVNATIYVMNYLCNLSSSQFLTSSNPTWDNTKDMYITEVGLYDDEKDLMIISKIQSPQKRMGVQQYSIKLDI